MAAEPEAKSTTVPVSRELKSRLDELKPYPSMSYEDLIRDMAEHYSDDDDAGVREL